MVFSQQLIVGQAEEDADSYINSAGYDCMTWVFHWKFSYCPSDDERSE